MILFTQQMIRASNEMLKCLQRLHLETKSQMWISALFLFPGEVDEEELLSIVLTPHIHLKSAMPYCFISERRGLQTEQRTREGMASDC